jgi:FtsP/CotA-like multicopper oxidase with cupredoxin domain
MKTRILFTLVLLTVSTLAFAQKSVPTCNSFDTTGAPIFSSAVPPGMTGTTLCTDFFGKGNYANSPLPAGPIDISATGFTIVDGGSGYTAPVVTIADALGTATNGIPAAAASCSATLTAGVITAITCSSAGNGYMAPMVSVADTTGTGAFILAKVSAAGPFTGGIRKFVDAVPDLKGALATPDITSFPGSDYYEVALVETTWQMHTDLPPSTVRGYVQVPTGSTACPVSPTFKYLGPVILAAKSRPVRVKFTNCLATGAPGNLFIPVDTTYMGAGNGPDNTPYTENRATLHLHGGNTPWISDGTPHQWTAPAGEVTNFKKGVSTQNVPDMFFSAGAVVPQCSATVTTNCSGGTVAQLPVGATNDPGDGSMTFYWTNQQGGRLMFYHDHAYGITRLNVYVGEAAGYYLYDPAEEAALAAATAPGTVTDLGHLIPMVIQDKTFVPSAGQLAGQDPTWIWGTTNAPGANGNGNGDLWFPHIYMPNQNPADQGAANAFGRWDYGAWFFPPQTTLTAAGPGGPNGDPHGGVTIPCTSAAFPNQVLTPLVINNFFEGCPITPNPSGTPEGFMDTPLVNGKAYPVLHVAPEAYRFQVLSAGNDRSWNLQLYVADATGMEVPTLPAVPPAATTPLPLCGSVTKITQPTLGLGLPYAALDATGNPINGTGLPLNCWPNYGAPSPGISSKQFMWPADGRDGGVPDPRSAGPPFIQIGTEGGLLPAPAVIPSTPVNYEVNTRSITITNVSTHGLWLGPAERADVIVDFSQFAGKTLILYNDAPTPTPAFDMRDDYYTGDLDESTTGGAPQTLPGYGPNTRTIMQIVVNGTPTATTPFSLASLQAALPAAFAATQPVPIVPEPTYPVASGAHSATTHYARVSDRTITFSPASQPVTSITVTAGGAGYSATTTVSIAAPGCVAPCATASAMPTIVGGVITAITIINGGSGYTAAPLVTIADPAATGSGASATANLTTTYTYDQKAIQELFTLDYGRMNATLGTELPLTSFQLQTTLPFGYAEWATEILQDGQTQLWYLTHNGVDTHFIHFHLFNVQVINRVGWDGSIRPPDQNELGWKDTVRMNPLENIVVAVNPITPIVPFPLPDSIRSLDPTMPDGVIDPIISGIDPATGNAITGLGTTNAKVNFGQEYVWHCHILGHEENDMMRPMIYQVAPPVPSNFVAVLAATGQVNLTWTDNAASESGFNLQRDTDPLFPAPATVLSNTNASVPNSAFGGTITAVDNPPALQVGQSFYYRLQAEDDFKPLSPLSGIFQTVPLFSAWISTKAGIATTTTILAPPITYGQNGVVTVTVTSAGGTVTGNVTLSVDGGAPISQALAGGSTIFTLTTPAVGTHTLAASYLAQGIFAASSATGTLVVNQAPLTITASSATVPYGSAIPAITPAIVGLVGTDTVASLGPLVCSTTATLGSPVGTYPSTCSGAVNANYAITYVAGTVIITGAPLTITASSATVPYGSAIPAITPTIVGLVNGDTATSLGPLVCSTTATQGSPAGTYPATCSGAVNANYAITYVAGTVTITRVALTITANNATRAFGAPNPAFTVAYAGFVNGDTPASLTGTLSCTTTATLASLPGTYPITCSGLTSISYTITYVAGVLTVTANGPVLTLAPTALTFSSAPNVTSAAQTVTVSNTGSAPLRINSITLGGTNPGRFGLTQNCPIGGTGLAVGGSCTISVTFTPNNNPATRTALVRVNVAAPAISQTVALTGTSLVPTVSVTPALIAFGNVPINTTSAPQTVTVSNTGTVPLVISSIATGSLRFVQTNNCPIGGAGLAVGTSCTIDVTFTPNRRVARTATLTIRDNAVGGVQRVTLTGTGQ